MDENVRIFLLYNSSIVIRLHWIFWPVHDSQRMQNKRKMHTEHENIIMNIKRVIKLERVAIFFSLLKVQFKCALHSKHSYLHALAFKQFLRVYRCIALYIARVKPLKMKLRYREGESEKYNQETQLRNHIYMIRYKCLVSRSINYVGDENSN